MNPQPDSSKPVVAPACFTAAQIAAALDLSRATVASRIPEDSGCLTVTGGNQARAWTFDQLPEAYREQIAKLAARHGLSVHDYLDSSARPWKPQVPFTQIAQADRDKAHMLQKAMAGTIRRLADETISPAELQRLGVEDYKAVFGFPIHADTWRKKLADIKRRARWDGDYTRAEIYLDENATRDPKAPAPFKVRDEFRPLACLIEGILKGGKPGADDRSAS